MICLNGIEVKPTIFPDKTSQVWKIPEPPIGLDLVISWKFESESEVFHLFQLKMLLNALGARHVVLEMDYLPYARQDKHISNEHTWALRAFAQIINQLNFYQVQCLDPHSSVASEIFERFQSRFPVVNVIRIFERTGSGLICFPDAGARDKYSEMYDDLPRMHATKERDQQTGQLKYAGLVGDPSGKGVLIVDDICDGGQTFINLAAELYDKGALEVNLFVTHGLFTKGLQPLFDAKIKRIFSDRGEHKL